MIDLPRTTPHIYVSSILALNISSPEHTGDWHSSVYWEHPENCKLDLWIFGEGQKFNTNGLLGELGIYRWYCPFKSNGVSSEMFSCVGS